MYFLARIGGLKDISLMSLLNIAFVTLFSFFKRPGFQPCADSEPDSVGHIENRTSFLILLTKQQLILIKEIRRRQHNRRVRANKIEITLCQLKYSWGSTCFLGAHYINSSFSPHSLRYSKAMHLLRRS